MNKNQMLGRVCELCISAQDKRGFLLDVAGEKVLLPLADSDPGLAVGEQVRVFLYRSDDSAIQATQRIPLAEVGDFVALRVKKVVRAGIFFDLGRGFELPVAIEEVPFRPKENERTLVRVELDEDGYLCGSCRIGDFLEAPHGFKVGDQVSLQVWRKTDLGIKMIISDHFEGLLYADELAVVQPGQKMTGYIARVREDGKVDLSLNPGGRAGIDIGREKILEALEASGYLPLHDGSTPEEIRRVLGLSKKQFKRAVGTLYREHLIELQSKGIRLLPPK